MKISDENLEKLLKSITPFLLSELEEVVSFENKTDEQREDIMKTAIKSLEVSAVLTTKFINDDSLNQSMLDEVNGLIEDQKLQEAADLINKF